MTTMIGVPQGVEACLILGIMHRAISVGTIECEVWAT